MQRSYDVVIVGGGLSAASCVEALREAGSTASVAVLAHERHAPYHRPPLTKGFVRGEKDEDDTLVEPRPWYEQHGVDLRLGADARRIDREAHQVELDDGSVIGYGTLVLATGAEPRQPDWPGDGDPASRVFTIRTIEDSERVRERLEPGARWLMVGGGYIGVETAASALERGCEVELVMQEPVLWTQFYGDDVGAWFQQRLVDHGARIHAADEVVRLDVVPDGVHATTKAGARIAVDYVLAGIGVTPRTDLASDAGLEVDSGVRCDRYLRAKDDDSVYAIGDICEYDSVVHGRPMRIEHWDVARSQGTYVGRRIAGAIPADAPYDDVPYFFSELGDWVSMQYVGPGSGDVIVRGSMEDGSFSAAYVNDEDRLVALLAVDHDDDLDAARSLLPDHPRMDRARLADDSVALPDAVLT
jgi:3-phenylpropionate/trans-cinnamate dioxygenase ferredoxin reductase subunit